MRSYAAGGLFGYSGDMNRPTVTDLDDINVLVASPLGFRWTEQELTTLKRIRCSMRFCPTVATTAIVSTSVPTTSS